MFDTIDPELIEIQSRIRLAHGWREVDDRESASNLVEATSGCAIEHWQTMARERTLEDLRAMLLADQRPVLIIGAAADPAQVTASLASDPIVIAADGSAGALEDASRISLVVSDADGWPHLQTAVEAGAVIALHAHGDNNPAWRDALDRWSGMTSPPSLILTHQTSSPLSGALNPGGFTDGDRAVCLAISLGVPVERIILVGFDDTLIGRWSGVTDPALKSSKLKWMAEVLGMLKMEDW